VEGWFAVRVFSLSGSEPHPSWGGWAGFLSKRCELRGSSRGVKWYGVTNCNYIVFPDGMLVANYGYHGEALMARIKDEGVKKVKDELVKLHQEWVEIKKRLSFL
jgi:hypothetical protein